MIFLLVLSTLRCLYHKPNKLLWTPFLYLKDQNSNIFFQTYGGIPIDMEGSKATNKPHWYVVNHLNLKIKITFW